MPESICICGRYDGACDGKCAGALMQQAECREKDHYVPPTLGIPGFCHRCGEWTEDYQILDDGTVVHR